MENLRINECLFHGIRDNYKQTSIEVLEDILKSKYILTYESLRGRGIFHEREHLGFQGNAISVCFHPENKILADKFKNVGIVLTYEEPAFDLFVNKANPSIIFSGDLLEKLPFRTFGGYKRMTDEIQVLSDISLDEMIAIGYPNDSDDLEKISLLLDKYGYQVPIINPSSGKVYKK